MQVSDISKGTCNIITKTTAVLSCHYEKLNRYTCKWKLSEKKIRIKISCKIYK